MFSLAEELHEVKSIKTANAAEEILSLIALDATQQGKYYKLARSGVYYFLLSSQVLSECVNESGRALAPSKFAVTSRMCFANTGITKMLSKMKNRHTEMVHPEVYTHVI